MIIRYDSPAAIADDFIARNCKRVSLGGDRLDWYNYETAEDSLRMTKEGNAKLVPFAERYLDKLDHAIETSRKVWEATPVGAYYSVPDVIAGRPRSMRRQIEEADDRQPITILVNTSSSAGIDAKTLEKRGVAILALVMALSRIRPVNLQLLGILHGVDEGETIMTAQINTAPLDLATACYTLTSSGFARRLTYTLAKVRNGFNGMWPRKFIYHRPEAYYEYVVQRLGLDPTKTLVIGAAQLGDELLDRPLVWIKKQIARFTTSQEDLVS
jgi:hypothetical protein